MGWVYKMRQKCQKEDTTVGEMVAICPKCHYILLIRDGEKPVWCPMCGAEHIAVKKKK